MIELLGLLLGIVRAALRSLAHLIAENLLLRHQLAVLIRPTRKRPRLRTGDKLGWVLARRLRADWRRHLVLVRPETVVRWHRHAWKLFWRWKSRTRLGRPRLSAEARELIATMSRENPLWGTERIRGELLKRGVVVSTRSIRRYRGRKPARPPSQTWRMFLATHRPETWATDVCTVQTLTFTTLDVLVFIAHGRRELVHRNVTTSPTAAWVWRQVLEATPWGRQPRYLIRDNDRKFGPAFARGAAVSGIRIPRTPPRAPRANAVCERFRGTVRRACLDHVLVLGDRHLRRVLAEYVQSFHLVRPHQGLGQRVPGWPNPAGASRSTDGPIVAVPVLGGLHHEYRRAA